MPDITIPISEITVDRSVQSRTALAHDTVAEYAEQYREGIEMPPVTVFHDGSTHWLGDGFHRVEAAKSAGLAEIAATVRNGSIHDARVFSAGANTGHGLRRTNADKRRAVSMLLADTECTGWSNELIARHCQVGPHLVAEMREHLCENRDDPRKGISANAEMDAAPATRTITVTRNGTSYKMKTGNIGKRPAAKPEATGAEPHSPWDDMPHTNGKGLLPCPFCGTSDVDLIQINEGWLAKCLTPTCGVLGPRCADDAAAEWGCELAIYTTRRMLYTAWSHVADNLVQKNKQRILRMLKEASGGKMTRSQLVRKTQDLRGKERDELLEDLAVAGLVRQEHAVSAAGRAVVVIRLV